MDHVPGSRQCRFPVPDGERKLAVGYQEFHLPDLNVELFLAKAPYIKYKKYGSCDLVGMLLLAPRAAPGRPLCRAWT